MNDMSAVIVPKSDQINADDLIAGPRTITVTEVTISPGTEQPVSIFFEGDGGKPYRPCKSMSRVLVDAWGPYAKAYTGRSMTLYRDASVQWGGMAVGGIRISALSHIDGPRTLVLTATKKSRKPHTVQPLVVAPPAEDRAAKVAAALVARFDAAETEAALAEIVADATATEQRAWLAKKRPELSTDVEAAAMAAQARTSRAEPGPATGGGR